MLTSDGYLINNGTSFLMALEFLDEGVRARAVLTYGQTGDATSPNFRDQLSLLSSKQWRNVAYSEEEVAADSASEPIHLFEDCRQVVAPGAGSTPGPSYHVASGSTRHRQLPLEAAQSRLLHLRVAHGHAVRAPVEVHASLPQELREGVQQRQPRVVLHEEELSGLVDLEEDAGPHPDAR